MKNIKHKIIIVLLLITILIVFIYTVKKEVKYVMSDIDNAEYLVRDLKDSQKAANMLARIKINIKKITKYLNKYKNSKYKEHKKYINQLLKNIKNVVMMENGDNGTYTSYSVNKGEQLVFCLRSKKDKDKIHDINLVMYVVLHELAHVACPEYGHGLLFKKIFSFMTDVAIELGFYKKVEFEKDPTEYCGLTITDSIV